MADNNEGNHEAEDAGSQGAGVHKENLLTRVVNFDQKSYYLDVRENARGKYLKLTESSSRRRNTILLSGNVLRLLQDVLNDAIQENYNSDVKQDELDAHWTTIFSRRVITSQKKIYVDLMQNQRGRSINVAEVHVSRPKTSVIISERGWLQFKRALEEIQAEIPEFANNKKRSEKGRRDSSKPKQRKGRNGAKKSATKNENVTENENGNAEGAENTKRNKNVLDSRKLLLPAKKFFFDFQENDLGRFCKVAEVRRSKRETVIIPVGCFPILITLLDLFMDDDFDTEVEGAENAEPPEDDNENHTNLARKVIEDENGRKFTVDLRENEYGRFLRLTETRASRSNCVFFPSESFEEIRNILEAFDDMP